MFKFIVNKYIFLIQTFAQYYCTIYKQKFYRLIYIQVDHNKFNSLMTVASILFLREGDNIFDRPIIKLKQNRSLTITLHYITIAFVSQYK